MPRSLKISATSLLEGKGGYIMAIEFGEREEGRIQNKISASVKTQSHYGNYRDILKSLCECIIGPIMFNRLIVYVLQNPDTDSFAMKLSAIKLAEEFSNKVRNIFWEVSVGMGRYYTDVLDAKKSFRKPCRRFSIFPEFGFYSSYR